MTRALVAITCVLLAGGQAAAQTPGLTDTATAHRDAMEKVGWMVGTWEGSGWLAMGPTGRSEFRGRETVEARLDGLVLVVEGVHHAVGGPKDGQLVHHALAFISWDPQSTQYRFRTHLAEGRAGDYTGRMENGAFVWGMESPRGTMRYTIRLDEQGRWSEIGEHSTDGATWRQVFAMELRRAGGGK